MNKSLNKYEKATYAKPKEVDNLFFHPMEECFLDKVREKGKIYWWKLFGAIPIFPYKAKVDKYDDPRYLYYKPTFNKIAKDVYYDKDEYYVDYNEKKIFKLPYVIAHYKDYGNKIKRFKTNAEAFEFCEMLAKTNNLKKE